MIAMALACDPAIVIGDEPTTALDVMVQAQILELLEDLRGELGLSLILITHDLSVIAETCDRVLIMYAGRVAEEGPVDEVFRRPRHPYTQKLLGAFPNIHADRRDARGHPGLAAGPAQPAARLPVRPALPAAMAICTEVVPPELTFDGVRVACHLYPAGGDGRARRRADPGRRDRRRGGATRRRSMRRRRAAAARAGAWPTSPLATRGPRGPFPDPARHRRSDCVGARHGASSAPSTAST